MTPDKRGKNRVVAWIGLGSNLGNGISQLGQALALLESTDSLKVMRVSPLYRTRPVGMTQQPEFTNAVAELSVDSEAMDLLRNLKFIETALGRDSRGRRWGPRTIDLDLLLYSDRILCRPGLTVPHPRMHKRAFVLVPLADLEPGLLIPARGTVSACLARLPDQGVLRVRGEHMG